MLNRSTALFAEAENDYTMEHTLQGAERSGDAHRCLETSAVPYIGSAVYVQVAEQGVGPV